MTDKEREIIIQAISIAAKYKEQQNAEVVRDHKQGLLLLDMLETLMRKIQNPSLLERQMAEMLIDQCYKLLNVGSYEMGYLEDVESVYMQNVMQ